MKRGEYKKPLNAEDRRRERNRKRLTAEYEKEQEAKRRYQEATEKQVQHLYELINESPGDYTREQKDFLDEYAIKHGIDIPINYAVRYDFGRVFSEEEAERLTPIFNAYILKEEHAADMVRAIINVQVNGITVKNKRNLALFFDIMRECGAVCDEWKIVIEKQNLFVGRSGGALTAKAIAKALQEAKGRVMLMNNPNGDSKSERMTKKMLAEMREAVNNLK